MADQEISVVITAKDEASKTIADLNKKVAKLEKDPATLLLTTNATKISKEMVTLLRQVDKLDASDPEIEVKTGQINALQGDLNQIESKLREIQDIKPGTAVDELGRSANSSKSALANMVGNSAQDLGQLSGVAGSAGVAIGQMAEYMADAALDAESFRKVISSFATVAGPIAALSIAIQAVGAVQKTMADETKRTAESVGDMSEAFRSAEGFTKGYSEALKDVGEVTFDVVRNQSALQNVVTGLQNSWVGFTPSVRFAANALNASKDAVEDITPLLAKAGVGVDQWVAAVEGGEPAISRFAAVLSETSITSEELDKILDALEQKQKDYADATKNAAIMTKFFGDSASVAAKKIEAAKLGEQIVEAIKDTAAKVKQHQQDLNDALTHGVADAVRAGQDSVQDWIDLQQRFDDAMRDTRRILEELADPFEAAARARRAFNDAFAEDSHIIDTQAQIVDVRDALRDLAEFIQRDMKGTIPNLLDPNDVNAGPYLDRFNAVRRAVQTRLEEVFVKGGPEAAKNWADRQVEQIFKTLGGKLTRDQIREQFGWEDLEVTLKVAVDKKSAKEAELLGQAIMAPLEVIGIPEAVAKARAEFEVKTKQNPFVVPVVFQAAGGAGAGMFNDAGGIVGPRGGIVAERRPEIVNSRWLITQPTVVPPGTRVTSGARTARILRTRGTAGLRRYDAGGVVAGAQSIHINVNAAVVGNRYDVMRAVKRAARDSDRLLGSRA